MKKSGLSISEAAHVIDVQSHVLRYWEEELQLPVARNDKGYRYYTEQDIRVFLSIIELKKKGMSLKQIKMVIPQFYKREGVPQTLIEEPPDLLSVIGKVSKKTSTSTVEIEPFPVVRTASVEEQTVEEPEKEPEIIQKKKERFWQVMGRVIKDVRKDSRKGEDRYQNLDAQIRERQVTRKMAAATEEKASLKRKGTGLHKRILKK